MTAREMLREIADNLHADKPHLCDVLCAEDGARATSLRTLADRLDAEMAPVAERRRRGNLAGGDLYEWTLLARLDAPLDVDPNTTR